MKIIACLILILAPSVYENLPECSIYTTITNCTGTVEVTSVNGIVVYTVNGIPGE